MSAALLSLREVARLLNVSQTTVRRRLIPVDGLPVLRVGDQLRFDPIAVQHWLDARCVQQAG